MGKNVDDDGFLAGVGAVAVETEAAVLVQSRGPLKKPVPSSPGPSRGINGTGRDRSGLLVWSGLAIMGQTFHCNSKYYYLTTRYVGGEVRRGREGERESNIEKGERDIVYIPLYYRERRKGYSERRQGERGRERHTYTTLSFAKHSITAHGIL